MIFVPLRDSYMTLQIQYLLNTDSKNHYSLKSAPVNVQQKHRHVIPDTRDVRTRRFQVQDQAEKVHESQNKTYK